MTETRVPGSAAQERIDDALDLLADLGQEFAGSLDLDETLLKAVGLITDYLDAAGGALFLLDESGTTLRCEASVGATDITGLTMPADQGIVGRSVQNNVGEIVRDVSKDPSFYGAVDSETGFTTKSILCAPLSVKDQRLGAIELINKKNGDGLFANADLRLLETLSSSAALAIINARMAAALVDQERLKRELELAAEIQRSLLPPEPDETYPVHGINRPARVVSGDFYDFFECPDGRIYFCLGDVSGKGMNAALLMAKASSLFRVLGKDGMPPGRLLARLNNEICETATRGMFVTMLGGVYDPATSRACIANAGHEPPLLHDADDQFHAFDADAPPLGIMPVEADASLDEREIDLTGSVLFVFTDGVTEGHTTGGDMLGVDALKAQLSTSLSKPLPHRLRDVVTLVSGGDLHDDITLLAVDGRKARS